MESLPLDRRRHAVVVIHGQGRDRDPRTFLIEAAGALADTLEEQGATVRRSFQAGGTVATADLHADPPPGSAVPGHDLYLASAFWDDAFPPPTGDIVYAWAVPHLWRQTWRTLGMLRDPRNARRGIPPAEQEARDRAKGLAVPDAMDSEGDEAVPFVVALLHALGVFGVAVIIVAGALAGAVMIPAFYVLSVLAKTPGIRLFGFWSLVSRALHTLDPFATQVMGDSQRYVEDAMWAAAARTRLELAVRALLAAHPDVEDLTLLGHSAGAGLAYDALLAPSDVVDLLPGEPGHLLPVRLITIGGAVNRYYWLSKRTRIRFARRFADGPVDSRLGSAFHWLDLYARFDYVSAGRLDGAVLAASGLGQEQLSTRQVVNFDNPLEDHFGYFANRSLAVSRILRTINGGDRFWPDQSAGELGARNPLSWEFHGARRRMRMLAWLQLVRLTVGSAAIAHLVLLWQSDWWRQRIENALLWINEPIAALAARLPILDEAWTGDLVTSVGRLTAVALPIVVLLGIERVIRQSTFPDLDLGRPRDARVALVGILAAALFLAGSVLAIALADNPP